MNKYKVWVMVILQSGCLAASLPPVRVKTFREIVIATTQIVTDENINLYERYILQLSLRAELYGTIEDRTKLNRLVAKIRRSRS